MSLILSVSMCCFSCSMRQNLKPNVCELAELSEHVYNTSSGENLPCRLVCENMSTEILGFSAASYINDFYKVVVFRGTDNVFDGIADLGLRCRVFLGKKPKTMF